MMALSIFQSQLPKTLLLGTLILLSSLTITVCASPTPSSHFSKLTQTLILRNLFLDVGNSTNTLLTLIPKTYKLTLPWWTTTPGTVQDFLIAFWTVTFAWEKRGSGDKPAGKLKIVRKMYAIVSLFVQSVSGLVHLALNSRGDGLTIVQRPGGNNYVALFAAACQLWHKTVLEHPRTLLVGCWINLFLALLHLILLSLPVVGSAPVFQASSPFCSYIVNANNGTGLWNLGCSNFGWSNGTLMADGYPGNQFTCASEWEMGLGRDTRSGLRIQSYFSWFFVFFIVLLLIGSVWTYLSNPIKRDEYRAMRLVGPVMRWTIMLAAIYAAVWIGIAYLIQSEDFKASVVVCPAISNSTLGAQVLNNGTCTCVDIQRPLNLPIETVLDGDSSALSRLISNF